MTKKITKKDLEENSRNLAGALADANILLSKEREENVSLRDDKTRLIGEVEVFRKHLINIANAICPGYLEQAPMSSLADHVSKIVGEIEFHKGAATAYRGLLKDLYRSPNNESRISGLGT